MYNIATIQEKLEEQAETEAKKQYDDAYRAFDAFCWASDVKMLVTIPNEHHKDPAFPYSKDVELVIDFHRFMHHVRKESIERIKRHILDKKINDLLEATAKIQDLTQGLEEINRG